MQQIESADKLISTKSLCKSGIVWYAIHIKQLGSNGIKLLQVLLALDHYNPSKISKINQLFNGKYWIHVEYTTQSNTKAMLKVTQKDVICLKLRCFGYFNIK